MCGRETPYGRNFEMLAFADHLHAQKPIQHTTGEGILQKSIIRRESEGWKEQREEEKKEIY